MCVQCTQGSHGKQLFISQCLPWQTTSMQQACVNLIPLACMGPSEQADAVDWTMRTRSYYPAFNSLPVLLLQVYSWLRLLLLMLSVLY